MNAKPMLLTLGLYLLAMTLAASAPRGSWFEAQTTGAKSLTLRGAAEYGAGALDAGHTPLVLTLGADSPDGAVIFTRPDGGALQPGVYRLDADAVGGVQALVVTGSPTRPTGAFHARSGTLTITGSRSGVVQGRFLIDAVGFEAADPGDESRELVVRGVFTASPSAPSGR